MTSKNSFFLNIRENIKRRSAVFAVFGLYFFFAFPVLTALYVYIEKSCAEIYGSAISLADVQSSLSILLGANGVTTVLITALAILCGMQGFSWLHHRAKTDFYNALPISKPRRFWVIYLTGMISFAACYLTALLMSLLLCAVMGVAVAPMLYPVLMGFVLNMLLYACIYGLSAVSALLTGNTVIACFGVLILLFYQPICQFLCAAFRESFFETSYSAQSGLAATGLFAPLFNLQALLSPQTQELLVFDANGIKYVLFLAVYAVLALCAAAVLFLRFPSESCGKALAFPRTRPLLKTLLLLPFALMFCLLLRSITFTSFGFALFGLFLGLALGHCILEAVFDFDLRSIRHHMASFAFCSAVSLCIFFSFAFDWFGYDRYVPSADALESAAWLPSYNGYNDFLVLSGDEPEYNSLLPLETMRLTDTDDLLALARAAVASSGKGVIRQPVYFTVKYNLKSGKEVYRKLVVDYAQEKELLNALYSQPEYKQSTLQLYDDSFTAQFAACNPLLIYHSNTDSYTLDASFSDFVEVYQKDYAASTFDGSYTQPPCGTLQISLGVSPGEKRYPSDSYTLEFPVYVGYVNTLKWLQSQDVDYAFLPDPDAVTQIDIGGRIGRSAIGQADSLLYPETIVMDSTCTDPAAIKTLLPHLVPLAQERYSDYLSGSVYVNVISTVSGTSVRSLFTFASPDDIPEDVLLLPSS